MDTVRGATLGALSVELQIRILRFLQVEVRFIYLILLVDPGFSRA